MKLKHILFVLALAFFLVPNTSFAWWNTNWQYRAPITIDNTANANTLTDYQVLVTVDTASLISAGKMNADCSDIRFVYDDDLTSLSYWIESGCNTATTKIWVKVPSIPASSTKRIYMYYGNPNATSISNGDTVFNFFDDFEGTALNTTKWNELLANGGYSVSNSVLSIVGGTAGWEIISSYDKLSYPLIVEYNITSTETSNWEIGLRDDSDGTVIGAGIDLAGIGIIAGSKLYRVYREGASSSVSRTTDLTTWTRVKLVWNSTTVVFYENDVFSASLTTNIPLDAMGIELAAYDPNSVGTTVYVDWVFIRKYTSPEPTTSVGSEEVFGVNLPPQITIYNPENTSYYHVNLISEFSVYDDNGDFNNTGLVLRYFMDEGAGTTVYDSSGNSNDGTIYGATWTEGKLGNALSFDGVDDYILIGEDKFNYTTFSVCAWIKTTSGNLYDIIVSNSKAGVGYRWHLFLNAGKAKFNIYSTYTTAVNIGGTTAVNDGNWHFLCGIYDGATAYLYVDGVLDANASATIHNDDLITMIGRNKDGNYFNDLIDEVRIYNRALSDEEIQYLYNYTREKFFVKVVLDGNTIYENQTYISNSSISLNISSYLTTFKQYNLTVFANDTDINAPLTTQRTVLFTIDDYEIINETYQTWAYETSDETYEITLRYNKDLLSDLSLMLVYDNEEIGLANKNETTTNNGYIATFSKTIEHKFIQTNETNVTFEWRIYDIKDSFEYSLEGWHGSNDEMNLSRSTNWATDGSYSLYVVGNNTQTGYWVNIEKTIYVLSDTITLDIYKEYGGSVLIYVNGTEIYSHISYTYPEELLNITLNVSAYKGSYVVFKISVEGVSTVSISGGPTIYYPAKVYVDNIRYYNIGDLIASHNQTLVYAYWIDSINSDLSDYIEGDTATITLNVKDMVGKATLSASFFAENSVKSQSNYVVNGNIKAFNQTFTIDYVNSGLSETRNYYANLTVSYDNQTRVMASATQSYNAHKIVIAPCNSTISQNALTFVYYDETTGNNIYGKQETKFDVKRGTANRVYSYVYDYNLSANYCIYPSWAEYIVNADILYYNDTYTTRTYYLIDATVNNITDTINLYLVQYPKEVRITVVDNLENAIEGAIVKIDKLNWGENRYDTVVVVKTNFEGKATTYLYLENVWYRFVVQTPDGLIYTFEPTQINYDASVGYAPVTLKISQATSIFGDKISYSCSFDEDTLILKCFLNEYSGLQGTLCLTLYKQGALQFTKTDEVCTTDTTSVLFLQLSNESAYYYWMFTFAQDNEVSVIANGYIDMLQRVSDAIQVLLAIILIGVSSMMGLQRPSYAIIMSILALAVSSAIGWIVISYASFISILIIAVIIIHKVKG